MKTFKRVLALLLTLTMIFTLVACKGDKSSKDKDKKNEPNEETVVEEELGYENTFWKLETMSFEGQEFNAEDLGLSMTLQLDEDGSFVMSSDGDEETGEWEETDDGFTLYDTLDETFEFVVDGDTATGDVDGVTMVFVACDESDIVIPEPVVEEGYEDTLWVLQWVEFDGERMNAEDLGLSISVLLNADGTCDLTSDGETVVGEWEEIDGGFSITDEIGDTMDLSVFADEATAVEDGVSMIFVKQ